MFRWHNLVTNYVKLLPSNTKIVFLYHLMKFSLHLIWWTRLAEENMLTRKTGKMRQFSSYRDNYASAKEDSTKHLDFLVFSLGNLVQEPNNGYTNRNVAGTSTRPMCSWQTFSAFSHLASSSQVGFSAAVADAEYADAGPWTGLMLMLVFCKGWCRPSTPASSALSSSPWSTSPSTSTSSPSS